MKVALFGIHKLLSDSLTVLEEQRIFPKVVIFPPIESAFHQICEDVCKRNNVPFFRPALVKDPIFIEQIRNFSIDRIIVAGYHQIFPTALWQLANMGALNCHGGLLPEERGPVPWKWAVYDKKPFSGITIHQMTEKVDQGKVFYKERIALDKDETAETLFDKISKALSKTLPQFFQETDIPELSNSSMIEKPGYRGQIPPELCRFDLNQTSEELERRVRGFSPRPGVIFEINDQRIRVKKVRILSGPASENNWIFKSADGYVQIAEFETL